MKTAIIRIGATNVHHDHQKKKTPCRSGLTTPVRNLKDITFAQSTVTQTFYKYTNLRVPYTQAIPMYSQMAISNNGMVPENWSNI